MVPLGISEVTELDFEAVLSGCLLLKVEPDTYTAYPDAFKANSRVKSSPATWVNLAVTLSDALQVCLPFQPGLYTLPSFLGACQIIYFQSCQGAPVCVCLMKISLGMVLPCAAAGSSESNALA